MDYSDSRKKLLQLKVFTKYGISALTLLGVCHCVLLYFGYDIFILHLVVCAFLFSIGISLSRVFDLCWIHKGCVTYVAAILACVVLKRHGIIPATGTGVQIARLSMTITGIILLILMVWKAKSKKSC